MTTVYMVVSGSASVDRCALGAFTTRELAKLLEIAEAAHADLEQSEQRAREATEKRNATT